MPMPVFLHRHGNGGQGDHVSVRVTLAGGRTTYSAFSLWRSGARQQDRFRGALKPVIAGFGNRVGRVLPRTTRWHKKQPWLSAKRFGVSPVERRGPPRFGVNAPSRH